MKNSYLFWGVFLLFFGISLLLNELNIYFLANISWAILLSIIFIIFGLYFLFQKNKIAKIILILVLSISVSLAAFKLSFELFHPGFYYHHNVIHYYK